MRKPKSARSILVLVGCLLISGLLTSVQAAEPSLEQLYYHFFASVVRAGKAQAN